MSAPPEPLAPLSAPFTPLGDEERELAAVRGGGPVEIYFDARRRRGASEEARVDCVLRMRMSAAEYYDALDWAEEAGREEIIEAALPGGLLRERLGEDVASDSVIGWVLHAQRAAGGTVDAELFKKWIRGDYAPDPTPSTRSIERTECDPF